MTSVHRVTPIQCLNTRFTLTIQFDGLKSDNDTLQRLYDLLIVTDHFTSFMVGLLQGRFRTLKTWLYALPTVLFGPLILEEGWIK